MKREVTTTGALSPTGFHNGIISKTGGPVGHSTATGNEKKKLPKRKMSAKKK